MNRQLIVLRGTVCPKHNPSIFQNRDGIVLPGQIGFSNWGLGQMEVGGTGYIRETNTSREGGGCSDLPVEICLPWNENTRTVFFS